MDRIDRTTRDLTQENIDKIASLFPDVVTEVVDDEGNVVRSIDFDALRDDLSSEIVSGTKERYQFSWPGKRKAKLEARTPTKKTMRPCPDKSVDWDTTKNLYIEGDNLEALKIMHDTYLGAVKLIFIDPPYNTGHDFIYYDDFSQSRKDYDAVSGDYDEEGGRLVTNLDTNGRFHSDWCSMMYPRLRLARDLLAENGAIFISIDDSEVSNLRKICDEVFGPSNFITQITWEKRYTRSNNAKMFASLTDHILMYRKSSTLSLLRESRSDKTNSTYSNPDNDPRGLWTSVSYVNPATKQARPNLSYPIINPFTGETVNHPTNAWKYEKKTYDQHVLDNRLYWGKDGHNKYPRLKKFLSEMDGAVPTNLWSYKEVGSTDNATKQVSDLLGGKYFDFPKPVGLIQKMIDIAAGRDSLILDFFSGSGTTAHAVMLQNLLDGGDRRFILIQLPEIVQEGSTAAEADYSTICDVGEERIRKAGQKIAEEVESDNTQLAIGAEPKTLPDLGFRVLRVADSCLKDVYRGVGGYEQTNLDDLIDNMNHGVESLDLLFQVLPAFRIEYSAAITEDEFGGKHAYRVNGNQLIACFDTDITDETIRTIAQQEPIYAVFRDASFADDSGLANLEQIFNTISPDTVCKVI